MNKIDWKAIEEKNAARIETEKRILAVMHDMVRCGLAKQAGLTARHFYVELFDKYEWQNIARMRIDIETFGVRFSLGGFNHFFLFDALGKSDSFNWRMDCDGCFHLEVRGFAECWMHYGIREIA